MKTMVLQRQERGVVYVEFLIVVIPFVILLFSLVQIGLFKAADLLVKHAAARAVRAAIVILPDEDEEEYANVPVNTIGSGGSSNSLEVYRNAPDDGRLDQIRDAAEITLTPLSPSLESYFADSMADALGEHTSAGSIVKVLGLDPYVALTVAVTFPDGKGGYLTEFPTDGPLTARVTYLYKCSVPIARALMCSRWLGIDSRLKDELATAGVNSLIGIATEFLSWRFLVIRAERTLPIQGRRQK